MLYQITARVLINVDDTEWPDHQTSVVTDGLNEMFRNARTDVGSGSVFVCDWAYDPDPTDFNEREIIARPDLNLDDYEEGEFLT